MAQPFKLYKQIQFWGLLLLLLAPTHTQAEQYQEVWAKLQQDNHVALLRHALAPGFGDPSTFSLEDCSTQRNLSEAGRQQARFIGKLFRDHGIEKARVLSSQWCRCMDTAELLTLGSVVPAPYLNSFFSFPERKASQLTETQAWFHEQFPFKPENGPVVLVTHQVNITALTGVYPDSGEIVIARVTDSGELQSVGTIPTR